MMYKNHLSRLSEELKFFDNSAMSLGEKAMKLELNPDEA